METLSGIATHISTTLSLSGGGEQPVSTTHIALFFLNGRQIRVRSGEPVMVGEGDHVRVVGTTRRGVFTALAYHNLSRGVIDHEGWLTRLMAGSVFIVMGTIAALMFSVGPFGRAAAPGAPAELWLTAIPLVLSLFFAGVGVHALVTGAHIRQAVRRLAQS